MPQPLRALSDELDAGNTQPDFLEFDVPDTTTPMPMESMFPVQDSNHLTLLRDWPHAVLALEMGREPRLLFWNSQAEHLLGYEALDLVGNPLGLTLLCPDQDYRTRKLSELQQLGAGGVDLEWTLTCRDGQKLRLAWSLLPMLQTQGVSRVFWLCWPAVLPARVKTRATRWSPSTATCPASMMRWMVRYSSPWPPPTAR